MDDSGLIPGFLAGLAVMWAYHHWNEPTALGNAADQLDGAVALTKFMSGQVGLIHGFMDDYEVCTIVKERLEQDGGYYGCVLQNEVAKNP